MTDKTAPKPAPAQPTQQRVNELVNEQIERALGQLVLENLSLKAQLRALSEQLVATMAAPDCGHRPDG